MTDAFISYAHADDARRERLSKHLATLRRDGLLREWSDHEILAGDRFEREIDKALEASGLFIALLSPDYLASNYCYDVEFKRAQELEGEGKLRIIGIVAEPCDWKNSPFRDRVVLPKDGKAVPDWTNENAAYLNVAEALRRILSVPPSQAAAAAAPRGPDAAHAPELEPERRLRIKQDFDAIQRSDFADAAFEVMRSYIEAACKELGEASEQIRTKYETMSSTAFTCTIVNRARTQRGEAPITIHRNKGDRTSAGDISFFFGAHTPAGTSNGWLSVRANDYELYLLGTIGRFGVSQDKGWRPRAAAEALWNVLMEQAGIEFDPA